MTGNRGMKGQWMVKNEEWKMKGGGSGGQELLYTLSAQYIPSKIVIHA